MPSDAPLPHRCARGGGFLLRLVLLTWCALAAHAQSPLASFVAARGPRISVPADLPLPANHSAKASNWIDQSAAEAQRKSVGCIECHRGTDAHTMHESPSVVLGCTDCHGGDPTPGLTQRRAHVAPQNPVFWESSANPNESSILLNHESAEFIQFVNPGDLRVAHLACGPCHAESVNHVRHSIMRHGGMLWGAALYNNGAFSQKNYRFGQAYGSNGVPLRLISPVPVSPDLTRIYGILPYIEPLPRFAIGQPSNILRIFEKGGERQNSLGIPNAFEPPGKPARRLSERGLGTLNRIDPVYLNLQKTRLHDPLLDFMGSNNHPGDYRSSGCSACHVVYANDRSPVNSDYYAKYGHQGLSYSQDPTILKNERGHPIRHVFTRAIPTSQCMNCHMHQGNLFVNPYLGYIWWDQETDGEFLYPHPKNPLAQDPHFLAGKPASTFLKQKNPTEAEIAASNRENPEASAARGLWGDSDFLDKVAELNPQLKHTQFADYHGHGWIFRAIFKRDKQGELLTLDDEVIPHDDAHKWDKAVHLKDVHLARGMHCVDCHFLHDMHGNGLLYGDPRAVTSIECIDCHGGVNARPSLMTSGTGGPYDTKTGKPRSIDLLKESNTAGGPRFFWEGKRLYQRSSLDKERVWEIPQTVDVINPDHPRYNPKAAYAKTLRRDGKSWGDVPGGVAPFDERNRAPLKEDRNTECARELAHDNSNVSCQVCHTSWATSCFGCHLPMRANQRVPANKFEGTMTRNYTTYNPQVVRDDVFQLGVDATYKGHRVGVLRSSSAVIVGSQNGNREWVYSQQQTVSAEGYSGQAYNPHFPHTTSSVGTTKGCTECHVSAGGENNAWMTSLLGFGTGTVNFFGRYAWVGTGKGGMEAAVWTEREEPQAAYGSHLHNLAYHDRYVEHTEQHHGELKEAYHHGGADIQDLLVRGEYVYTANGPDGFQVFDIANLDQKGFSERIVSAPVSPLGQRLWLRTPYATSVTSPTTLGVDPLRKHYPKTEKHPEFGEIYSDNEEQDISLVYALLFVTDLEEGLVMPIVGTLVDGNPDNNFLDPKKDVIRFNPDGKFKGARHSYMAGTNLLVVAEQGLFAVRLLNEKKELKPSLLGELTTGLRRPTAIAVQFHYAFISDADGVKVVDIADLTAPRLVATVPLKHAGRLYAARTYLYVPNGPEGLAFIDIQNPEKPRLLEHFTAGGVINDARAVQIGSIAASMYALLADGKNGLRVIQMISPENVPGHYGFSPKPNPKLIATYHTHQPAIAVSRGLDRDRVVDESGNQTVVFGRRGSRPFNLEEMAQLLRHTDPATGKNTGPEFRVEDVVVKSGQLQTKAGTELQPTRPFQPEPAVQLSQPRPTGRLFRRGRE
jgi:hypothetical protein